MAAVLDRYGTGPRCFGAACWIPGVKTERTAKKWGKKRQKWARYSHLKRVRAALLCLRNRYPLDSVPPTPHPGLPTNSETVALQDWQALGFCNQPDMKPMCEPLSAAYPPDMPPEVLVEPADFSKKRGLQLSDSPAGPCLPTFEDPATGEDTAIP